MPDHFTYSFGIKSPIKFQLHIDHAEEVNQAIESILNVKKEIYLKHGYHWHPSRHMYFDFRLVDWPSEEIAEAYFKFEWHLDRAVKLHGLPEYQKIYFGHYLVCNNPPLTGPFTSDGKFYTRTGPRT